jgi:hypothetical protein
MKSSTATTNGTAVPSVFQLAAYFEELFPPAGFSRTKSALSDTPIADLLSHPEKMTAMLKAVLTGNNPGATTTTAKRSKSLASSPDQKAGPQKRGANTAPKPSSPALGELKKVEFSLRAPAAGSVKLAADFTDWEMFPLEMMRSADGVWFTMVPLAPGQYAYRFIVDGEWRDDPHSFKREPNPFGAENAVVLVR